MRTIDRSALSICLGILMTTLNPGCWSGFTPGTEADVVAEGLLPLQLQRPQEARRRPDVAAPVSGGTLLVSRDGKWAVASDPDAATVTVVNLATQAIANKYHVGDGAAPGSAAEGAAGDLFVVLRGRDSVLKLVPGTDQAPIEQRICAEPRGVAVQATLGRELVQVVCAGGQLVTLAAGDLHPLAVRQLGVDDLRGVKAVGDELWIYRFRQTAVLRLRVDGRVEPTRIVPPPYTDSRATYYLARVTYGLIPRPGAGGAVLLHQGEAILPMLPDYMCTPPRCPTPILPLLSLISPAGSVVSYPIRTATRPFALAVDASMTADGKHVAVLSADRKSPTPLLWGELPKDDGTGQLELKPVPGFPVGLSPIAVYAQGNSGFVVQCKNPGTLYLLSVTDGSLRMIKLDDHAAADPGVDLFYSASVGGLSCAGCHPEAESDGAKWKLPNSSDASPHQTQSLAGLLRGSTRFHWNNEQSSLSALIQDDLRNLGFQGTSSSNLQALEAWLTALPSRWNPPIALAEQKLAERGQVLFREQGCASCHAGSYFTQDASVAVTTGAQPYKVPSLLQLTARDPYFHDGCAATLSEVFDGKCAGVSSGGDGVHDLRSLGQTERASLISYLRSL